MVRYDTILKVIDETVKCISLKSIREQISPTLKQITDSQDEYDCLMNEITHFYRDHYTKGYETVRYRVSSKSESKVWENEGDEFSVPTPTDAQIYGEIGGYFDNHNKFLLSIHNHPKGSCYPSNGDFENSEELKVKYMIACGRDGISISKRQGSQYMDSVEEALDEVDIQINDGYKRDSDWKKFKAEYDKGAMSYDELNLKTQRELQKYLQNNVEKFVSKQNKEFANKGVHILLEFSPIET